MIPIVIPALNPDEKLPAYCRELRAITDAPIVVVDDGSSPDCQPIFDECARTVSGVTILRHEVNHGKGRALKTAFSHLLSSCPDLVGCVTADADGQHSAPDVLRCMDALRASPDALVLGCRTFTGRGVPFRSRLGNLSVRIPFFLATGRPFADTQTGLRAIPAAFMRELLGVPGERFDFETRMLLAIGRRPLVQVPIRTIYIDGNRSSHFRPFQDTVRITSIVLSAPRIRTFALFVAVSLLSWVVDQRAFSAFFRLVFRDGFPSRLLASVACARVLSLVFNYLANRHVVFRCDATSARGSFPRYLLLAIPLLLASWGLTHCATKVWPGVRLVELLKMAADLLLFIVSFAVQKLFVFRMPE